MTRDGRGWGGHSSARCWKISSFPTSGWAAAALGGNRSFLCPSLSRSWGFPSSAPQAAPLLVPQCSAEGAKIPLGLGWRKADRCLRGTAQRKEA